MSHHHHDPDKPELDAILRREDEIMHVDEEILHVEEKIEHEFHHPSSIKIAFKGAPSMADAVAGPIVLTSVGETATASVIVYDQFGAVFTGNFPNPTFTASDTAGAVTTFNPISGLVTAVGNGVNSITGSLTVTGPDGNPLVLTDTETVTVALAVVPPVPTTIKVAFSTTSTPSKPVV
jgi:hypothetical protein